MVRNWPGDHMNSGGICLITEDDLDIRDLLSLPLSGAGFEVHAEATGAAGLRAAKRLNLTLITLDLGLPDLTDTTWPANSERSRRHRC